MIRTNIEKEKESLRAVRSRIFVDTRILQAVLCLFFFFFFFFCVVWFSFFILRRIGEHRP